MTVARKDILIAILVGGLGAALGCEKSQQPTPPAAGAPSASKAADDEPVAQPAQPTEPPATSAPSMPEQRVHTPADGSRIQVDSIRVVVPTGWVVEAIPAGPMAPKCIITIPRAEGDDEDGEVRVTHFPGMKGMDDANIERWLGQVRHSDGSTYSRDEANVSVQELGNVRLTMLNMSGIVSATMTSQPKAEHRMIAAIIDHPDGPHFVVASGPTATIEKWHDDIVAFLTSASVE